jgi:uncharacterized integral membrane protein (TIGR00698 family)
VSQPLVVHTYGGGDPYTNPELFRWAGSMEGLPDWVEPEAPAAARLLPDAWRNRAHELLESAASVLPGLGLACVLALIGEALSAQVGFWTTGTASSPISPILIAILCGLAVRNAVGLPAVYDAGLLVAIRRVLRIGVALLGIRLSLSEVGRVGVFALPIVAGCIATALLAVTWLGRAIGVPPRLAALVAVGTAICGNTAIVATAPVIRAQQGETSYAVACITLFGLLALLGYPFLSHWLFAGDGMLSGLFLGTAIHDTAQVAGAGLLYLQQYHDPAALDTATVTKLVRNVCMVAVIPLVALAYRDETGDARGRSRVALTQVIPWFVVAFVAMALLRTAGDLGAAPFGGLLAPETWKELIGSVSWVSGWCLALAMASVGLGTDVVRMRSLGWKPLGVGLCAAFTVGAVSAASIHLLRWWKLI